MTIIPQAGCKRRWRGALVAALLLLGFGTTAQAQVLEQDFGPSSFRVGFNRLSVSGATYTLKDAANQAASNSDSMTGTEIYAEYVFFSRFGVEVDLGLTEMEREYNLASGGLTSSVVENARLTAVYANLYFQEQSSTGFKLFFGLGTGVVSVEHNFAGALVTGSSQKSVRVNLLKGGVDWLTDKAGFRAQIISMQGDTDDAQELPTFIQTIDYTATVFAIGVFVFF